MTSTSGLIGNFGRGQLRGGQARRGGAVQVHRAGHGALQRALELHRALRLEPHDQLHPAETDDEKARVAKLKKMEAGKVAPLAVYLASDAAAAVNAQVFAVRANEIMLMSQPRPLRSVHHGEGWTPNASARSPCPRCASISMRWNARPT